MTAAPATVLEVGTVVAERDVHITRDSLVRYAGASGRLTRGIAVQPVAEWLGDSGWVAGYGVRFTRPVVVDPEQGATVGIVAKVGTVDEDGRPKRIDLTVTAAGQTVLGKAQVTVVFR
jgi:acyl dehydratase